MEEISARAWAMKRDTHIFQTTKQLSLKTCSNKATTKLVLHAGIDKEM
jgi:hypothetical protein